MAIGLDLADERGNRIDEPRDIHDFVERAARFLHESNSSLLRYVDPYGTLVLNARQMG